MLREKLPFYLLCLTCLTVSSFAQTLGTTSLTFGPGAGSGTVEVNGGALWTVSTNVPWLTVTQNGQGRSLLFFSFTANPGPTRTGTITVTDNNIIFTNHADAPQSPTNVLTVTQAGLGYVAASGLTSLGTSGLSAPCGVGVDTGGNVYLAGLAGNTGEVEKWSPATGQFTTLVSSGLVNPCGVAVDTSGNVYIADEGLQAIEEWNASNSQLTTLIPLSPSVPYGVAVDSAGDVFMNISVADPRNSTDDFAILEWNPTTGGFTTIADNQVNPGAIAVDANGNVYNSVFISGSAETGYAVQELVAQSGYVATTLFFTAATTPSPVAVDGAGNVYFSVNTAPPGALATWVVEEWNASTNTVGPPLVNISTPGDFAVDPSGNIYFGGLQEYLRAYVNPTPLNEPATAGSDQLPQVLPSSTPLNAVSDQSWLTITNQSSGIVSFSFTANSSGASRSAHISVLGQSITVTQAIGAPSSITATSGTPQTAQINTAFASPLTATVIDSGGFPVGGVTVTFAVQAASGASGVFANGLPTATATTNTAGLATAPAFTANAISGSYNVSATVANVPTAAIFALTNSPGPPALVTATAGTPQSAPVKTNFKTPLQVLVQDASGNPVSGVAVNFATPTSGASATLSSTTVLTNAAGLASVNATANGTAGSYTVTATVLQTAAAATFVLTNTAGAPASVIATAGTPQSAAVSTAFTTPLQVIVRDANGNPLSGVAVTFAVPVSGASATLSSTTALTNSAGLASVNATANGTAGSYTATATVPQVAAAATFALTNTAGAPASIVATAGTPQSATVSTAFTTPLQVVVQDANSNPVSGVAVTFAVPASGASATLSSTTALTNSAGVASVNASANKVAGSYTVIATVPSIKTFARFALTNTAGAPASVIATAGTPQSAAVSTAFTTPLQVIVQDANGNPVSGMAVTFVVPASGASATLSSTTVLTNSAGLASVNATANGTTGSYTATATVPQVAAAATFALTNTAGAPASIVATAGTPQSATVSTAFTTPLQVVVQDANRNPVSGVAVTFAVPVSGASATLSSTTALTNNAGVASVNASANKVAGSYTVIATVPSIKTFARFALTNTAGAPASITATSGTPQSATVKTAFNTALQVTVQDANGNPVSGVAVTFAVPASGASATLSSTTVLTNAAGLASVNATANGTAGGYSVSATVASTATSTTFALTNTAGAPAAITALSGTPQSAQIGTAFKAPLAVSVTDSTGNPVGGVVITYAAPSSSGASGTFANGINTASTNTQGIATSAVFTANGIVGSFTVTATAANIPKAATFSLANTPSPLRFPAPSLPSGKVGTPYSATLSAQGGTLPYTWSLAPKSSALPSGLTLNASTGAITGTPTTAGSFDFTLQVSDSSSPKQTVTQQVSNFVVLPPTLTLSCSFSGQAKVGVAYSGACKAAGGTPPYAYSIATGSLPPGLDLDSATGTVTGAATGTGVYSFALQVIDSSSPVQTARQSLTITAVTTLVVTTATLPGGTVGAVYTAAINAQGGTLPYAWAISGGSLPPGLTLNSGTGMIGGKPTTPGSYSFSIIVTDSSVPAQIASQTYANITITQIQITTSSLPVGTAGLTYDAALAAQGGVAPYTWSIASGSLPSGLKLDSSTGALSGTPLVAGAFSLTVQVTDSSSPSQSASRSLTLTLNAPQATLTAPATQAPSQPLTVTFGLNQTTTAVINGTVALTFTPNADGVSPTYMDPALGFVNVPAAQATTYTFSVAAGAQTVTIPQIQPGTVAGDITITATLAGQTVSVTHVVIDALPPTIDSTSVQFTNMTSDGFDIEFNATSTPRNLTTATFTFTAASGATLNGTTTFPVPVSSEATTWYANPASGAYGSRLSLSVPFSFSGSAKAIASVTITLTNSAGQSTAVTGTP